MNRIEILGCPVDPLPMDRAVSYLASIIENRGRARVVTLNPEMVMAALREPELRRAIRWADLVVPDGAGIVLVLRRLGIPAERVAGVDLGFELMKVLAGCGGSVYLLGGRPGAAEAAGRRLSENLRGLSLAGFHHGFFSADEEAGIVAAIRKARPHLLLVGMGAPRQELWLARHWADLDVSVGIGIGGAIDVWAGLIARAPRWMRRYGLEWLHRALGRPSRWRRLMRLPVFLVLALTEARRGADGWKPDSP